MILRLLVISMMAVGLGGFALFFWRAEHQPPQPSAPVIVAVAKPPPVMVMVMVAGRDLMPGTFLRPDDLTNVSMAREAAPASASIDTPDARAKLIGALVRRPIQRGSAMALTDLLLAGDHGFLTAILQPGMRAYTIPPEQILSNPGLIWPGDRIDLILTQQMPATVELGHQISGETVLGNLRVLAIDRQLLPPVPTDTDKSGSTAAQTSAAVTVEVSPENVQRLAVALRLGKVGLAVCAGTVARSVPMPTGITWAGSVMRALSQTQPQAASMHVFEGSDDKEYKF